MAYIVQAATPDDPGNAASATFAERGEALRAALNWEKEGVTGIKIIGDGRIYTVAEFALKCDER